MDRKDSSAAISSIASYAGDSDRSDDEVDPAAVDHISDEDMDLETNSESEFSSRPTSRPIFEDIGNSSSHSISISEPKKEPKRAVNRLVSYGPDDDDRSDDEEGDIVQLVTGKDMNSSLSIDMASSLSRSVQHMEPDDITIPPEPPGRCPKHMQEKISNLYEKMKREDLNLSQMIHRRQDFRNPSIYEKLIEYCGIDEKGTNYPPDLFNPHCWGKESYYDALGEAQKKEMEKREKEKKERTKVEFVTATKKAPTADNPDEKKRKSKWDSQPSAVSRPAIQAVLSNSNVATLSAGSGTKATVIPAVGNLTKKPK